MKNCFELSRNTGRTYLFSCLKSDTTLKWTSALMEEIFPPYVLNCVNESHKGFQRVGKLLMRTQNVSKKGSLSKVCYYLFLLCTVKINFEIFCYIALKKFRLKLFK